MKIRVVKKGVGTELKDCGDADFEIWTVMTQEGLERRLDKEGVKSLVCLDGSEIIEFVALEEGGKYGLGAGKAQADVRKRPLVNQHKFVVSEQSVKNDFSIKDNVATFSSARLADVDIKEDRLFHLYLRDGAAKQLLFLKEKEFPLIRGPPGCGKSVVAWLFALGEGKTGKKVLWHHYTENDVSACFITNDMVSPVLEGQDDLTDDSVDILIMDDLSRGDENISIGMRWRAGRKNRKLCIITSQQLDISFKYRRARGIDTLEVPSWTKEEYLKAVEIPAVKKQVTPYIVEDQNLEWDEQFEDKYILAGGSCRFMFHYKSVDVMEAINEAVRTCGDVKNLLSKQEGDRAPGSVNTLLQTNTSGRFIISEYAMRLLSQVIEAEFISLAKSASFGNAAFDGWILEMDFLMQIKRKSSITLFSTDGSSIIWEHHEQMQFHDPSDLLVIKTGWLVPDRWNQGGYDAVRVEIEEKKKEVFVQFVQVTRAGTHSFKPRFMNAMMTVIEQKHKTKSIKKAFYFVVPRGHSFQLPTYGDQKWNPYISVLEFDRT